MSIGQKFTLMKNSQLRSDPSLKKIRVAILGVGEVFGLEECEDGHEHPRKKTVVCT